MKINVFVDGFDQANDMSIEGFEVDEDHIVNFQHFVELLPIA